ncbi:MAG: hypothetical protein ACPGZP_03030 [Panacagrimonas sp.]
MKPGQRASVLGERIAALKMDLAARSARNRSWFDKICRVLITRVMTPPGEDFMRDELVDNHPGFDADALARYQRGEG